MLPLTLLTSWKEIYALCLHFLSYLLPEWFSDFRKAPESPTGLAEISDFWVSPLELWFNNLRICIPSRLPFAIDGELLIWELYFENHHPTPPHFKSFRDVFNVLINGFISCSKHTWAYRSKPNQTKQKIINRMNKWKMHFWR